MTKRWIRSVSLLLLACILLSGCDWLEDPKSLMSMPRLPEDKAKIMTIISSQMPKEAEMLRPANAEDASAIRLADLNNDGRADTAIVFYETPDRMCACTDSSSIAMERRGTKWLSSMG